MNHSVSSRRRAALPLLMCLAAFSSTAWSAPPVLQPSQIIEAPADPGPLTGPAAIGYSISVDDDRMLVGSANGYIYRKNRAGDWEHRATLVIPDASFRLRKGIIHGDTAVINTLYANLETLIGRVYVYRRVNGAWSLVQTIDDPANAPGSLAVSSIAFDGETIVLGSYLTNSAYVYSRNATGMFELTATLDEPPLPPPYNLNYGVGVAVEGRTLAVGALGADNFNGAVYIYRRVAGTWHSVQVLSAGDPQQGSQFGTDLVLSRGLLLVTAPTADPDPTGNVPTIGGAAYVFAQNGAHQWYQEKKIANPTNGSFARSIAFDGRRAVLGAYYIRPHDDDPYGTPFAFSRAFVYERSHGNWSMSAVLEGFQPSNNFAFSPAIQARHVFAGDATVQTPDPLFDGQVYEFTLPHH